MICFCGKSNNYESNPNVKIIKEDSIRENTILGSGFWGGTRLVFAKMVEQESDYVSLVPVFDNNGKQVAFCYQDTEARRELRMLREMLECSKSGIFSAVFPGINRVVIDGLNELAFVFKQFLDNQGIDVVCIGYYWKYFDVVSTEIPEIDGRTMYIDALGRRRYDTSPESLYKYSVSPEFECVDDLYDYCVDRGLISSSEEGEDSLLSILKGKSVYISGIGIASQNLYEYLLEKNINTKGYIADQYEGGYLLGMKIYSVSNLFSFEKNVVVLSCCDKNSAYGNKEKELYDYYGLLNDIRYYNINDYVDIPRLDLRLAIKGKNILLAGDEMQCCMARDYLCNITNGDCRFYLSGELTDEDINEDSIFLVVRSWEDASQNEANMLIREAKEKKYLFSYYYSDIQSLFSFDRYFSKRRHSRKYNQKALIPKGIILSKTYGWSGNVFFDGIMDGHPDVVKINWGVRGIFRNNLMRIAISLANFPANEIINIFWDIIENSDMEWAVREQFYDRERFNKALDKMLEQADWFTSQELFMIFHIAFYAMTKKEDCFSLDGKIIFWEPHMFNREEFCYLEEWLYEDGINGTTFMMVRDNIHRVGSISRYYDDKSRQVRDYVFYDVFMNLKDVRSSDDVKWNYITLRFEDVKLNPKEELMKLCDMLELDWSDTMLSTTENGKSAELNGVKDFDIWPVFNRNEKYISELDRLRMHIACSYYQKKYGYTYEDIKNYSRKEVQDIFIKEWRLFSEFIYDDDEEREKYWFRKYDFQRWALWTVRQRNIDNVEVLFPPQDMYLAKPKGKATFLKHSHRSQGLAKDREEAISYIKNSNKIVLYGTGTECDKIIELLGESEIKKLEFCDKRAKQSRYSYCKKPILSPDELKCKYKEYDIYITSYYFYGEISMELEAIGVSKSRIYPKRVSFLDY